MQLTFRAKLLLIVAAATISLIVVSGASTIIGWQQDRELEEVQHHLVPRLKLGPELDNGFTKLRRSLQDAVAAQEPKQLESSLQLRDQLLKRLSRAKLPAKDAQALSRSIEEYHRVASNVSERLIAGETGESIVSDMEAMQAEQARVEELLETSIALDPKKLDQAFDGLHQANRRADELRGTIGVTGLLLVMGLSFWLSRSVLLSLRHVSTGFARFATGRFDQKIPEASTADLGNLAAEANQMATALAAHAEARERADWLKERQAGLYAVLRQEAKPTKLAARCLRYLADKVGAAAGIVYLREEDGGWSVASQLAVDGKPGRISGDGSKAFAHTEGLVGRAAAGKDLLVVENLPPDYYRIRSGLGEALPDVVVLSPLVRRKHAVGVIELAMFGECPERTLELLRSASEPLATAFEASVSRAQLEDVLAKTKLQAERLTAQEEELRANNAELQAQQEELKAANEELEAQRVTLRSNNESLEAARRGLQEKADELARVSSYKSQFLANMSHELRTPLNSMLLLSHLLTENEGGHLTPKQVEHCRTIHSAGEDLLKLINQILDLAKIESGRKELNLAQVPVAHFVEYSQRRFSALAQESGLKLVVEAEAALPENMVTDTHLLEGILTNLIGNALKFTGEGRVTVRVKRPDPKLTFRQKGLTSTSALAFEVSDTGPGIPEALQEKIFIPFEQIETSTNRRYGGTGLGLAIARESARLLGGELHLESRQGNGSTFTCYVPERSAGKQVSRQTSDQRVTAPVLGTVAALPAGRKSLLVVEDDAVLAEQLSEIIRARGLHALTANSGALALQVAREPGIIGIVLDVRLPDMDGWAVMDRLRQDPVTRHIPVHFVTAIDTPEVGLALGAVGYLVKPVTHAELTNVVFTLAGALNGNGKPRVLVVEDNQREGDSIVALLQNEPIEITHVLSASAALEAVNGAAYGCMVLDLGLPDMDGLSLLEHIRQTVPQKAPRVVVHTGRSLTKQETTLLENYAQAVILKDGRSGERLLEEIRCFVRHVREGLEAQKPGSSAILSPSTTTVSLRGHKILLAEDDMRTVYALSALLLGKGADVVVAENGREAIELLKANPDIHGVLMDIMMPEMDGYEAMKQIRNDSQLEQLPVIALTAKAMKGERQRCLEAGANDYLTKPVDADRLLETLNAWVNQGGNLERSD